jgi:hypothetical protein
VIHLCDTIIASVPAFEYCLIIDISSITPTTKKVIERLKDTFDRRRCPGNKAVNTSLFGTSRNSKLKFTARSDAAD